MNTLRTHTELLSTLANLCNSNFRSWGFQDLTLALNNKCFVNYSSQTVKAGKGMSSTLKLPFSPNLTFVVVGGVGVVGTTGCTTSFASKSKQLMIEFTALLARDEIAELLICAPLLSSWLRHVIANVLWWAQNCFRHSTQNFSSDLLHTNIYQSHTNIYWSPIFSAIELWTGVKAWSPFRANDVLCTWCLCMKWYGQASTVSFWERRLTEGL